MEFYRIELFFFGFEPRQPRHFYPLKSMAHLLKRALQLQASCGSRGLYPGTALVFDPKIRISRQ